jgi:hypothetical protein
VAGVLTFFLIYFWGVLFEVIIQRRIFHYHILSPLVTQVLGEGELVSVFAAFLLGIAVVAKKLKLLHKLIFSNKTRRLFA